MAAVITSQHPLSHCNLCFRMGNRRLVIGNDMSYGKTQVLLCLACTCLSAETVVLSSKLCGRVHAARVLQVVIFRREMQFGEAATVEDGEDEFIEHGAADCLGIFAEQDWTGRLCFSGPGMEGGDELDTPEEWDERMAECKARKIECKVVEDAGGAIGPQPRAATSTAGKM